MRAITLLWLSMVGQLTLADDAPFITRSDGEVFILTSPSKVLKGEPPRMKYNGHYYNVKKAELGDELTRMNIIKTESTGKAKLIYPNGDIINIGPGTMFKIDSLPGNEQSKSVLNLLIGKFRALIDPEGPRANTQIRARSMAMGVRGTDFYINTRNQKGAVEINVIRGELKLAKDSEALTSDEQKTVSVKTGQVAEVDTQRLDEAFSEAVILRKMEKGDLIAINSFTGIDNRYGYGESMMALTAKPKSKLEQKLDELEKMAAEKMHQDMERHTPDKLQGKDKPKTTDQIDYVK